MRVRALVCAAGLTLPTVASADPAERTALDRFAGTLSLGASVGVGSPQGLAGAFLEVRPVRWLGVGVGGGLGGAFGPAVDGQLWLSPVGTRGWAVDLGLSVSRNFSWTRTSLGPNRPSLPGGSTWLGAEVASEFRASHTFFIRVGVGHAWLMNTTDFAVATPAELAAVGSARSALPGTTPLDAVAAAAQGRTLDVWFVHVDLAPSWRL